MAPAEFGDDRGIGNGLLCFPARVQLPEEQKLKRYVCVSLEPRPRRVNGVTVLPWRQFLDALWTGAFST